MNSNFRKGILLALSLFSSQAFSFTGYDCLDCNRFYVGGMVGASSMMDRQSTNTPTRDVHDLSALGAIGGAILGFDFCMYKQVRFGLEGFANATSIDASAKQDFAPQSAYTVKMRYNMGIRALPTYDFTPQTAGHLILGYSYGKFNIHDNGNYGLINKMFGQNGIQLGLGAETHLTQRLLLRGDTIYTAYPSQDSNGVTTSSPSSIQIYTNKLSTLEANLAIIYKL